MLNSCVLMGRLTADPELRKTQSGLSVTSFTLAVERDFKDNNGNKITDFIPCVAWRQTAEFVCKYFAKGQMAIVEGSLQTRDWQDNNGNKRRAFEILANTVYFGGSKKDEGGGNSYNNYGTPPPARTSDRSQSAPAPKQMEMDEIEDDDDELPF